MKFSNYLTQIKGVSMYPLISLGLFVCFFIAVTWYAFKINKHVIEEIENIPLNQDTINNEK